MHRPDTASSRQSLRSQRLRLSDAAGDPSDAYDDLLDLFVDDEPRGATRFASDGPGPVEVVLNGHLPRRSAVWVKQYALQRAEELGGPIALIRLMDGGVAVELVGLSAGPFGAPPHDLRSAILAAKHRAAGWVVRVDTAARPDDLDRVDDLSFTLFSGSDDDAAIDAYRTLKAWSDAVRAEREVSLVVAGPSEVDAGVIASRLSATANRFLGLDVVPKAVFGSLQPVPSTVIFRSPEPCDLAAFLGVLWESGARVEHTAEPAAGPAGRIPASERESEAGDTERVFDESDPRRGWTAGDAVAAGGVAHHASMADDDADLLNEVVGLRPLGLVCPAAPMVRFGADEGGRIHALVHELAAAAGETDGVRALLISSAWCEREHGESPVRHLFTTSTADAIQLAGEAIRVHLVAPVDDGAATRGWTATPIVPPKPRGGGRRGTSAGRRVGDQV